MRFFGAIAYIVLALITALPASVSLMLYDSPFGNSFLKLYIVISFFAVPTGFFFGHFAFLPYPSEFTKKLAYLPLIAFGHAVLLYTVVSILGLK